MSVVTLRPKIPFSGDKLPTAEELDQLHHKAHEECYIANSVKTEIRVERAEGGLGARRRAPAALAGTAKPVPTSPPSRWRRRSSRCAPGPWLPAAPAPHRSGRSAAWLHRTAHPPEVVSSAASATSRGARHQRARDREAAELEVRHRHRLRRSRRIRLRAHQLFGHVAQRDQRLHGGIARGARRGQQRAAMTRAGPAGPGSAPSIAAPRSRASLRPIRSLPWMPVVPS